MLYADHLCLLNGFTRELIIEMADEMEPELWEHVGIKEPLLHISQASAIARIRHGALHRLVRRNEVHGIKTKNGLMFRRRDLRPLLEERLSPLCCPKYQIHKADGIR